MGVTMNHCPFSRNNQLNDGLDSIYAPTPIAKANPPAPFLPGQPRVRLDNAPRLIDYLKREFCAPDLESMAPHLWMMSTQSSASINPLHRQRVKGREIIITEDPRLHLVWMYGRIFMKPLPKYLLSHAFWTEYLLDKSSPLGDSRHEIRRAALGYLRTFYHLVQHESDFSIAQDEKLHLIPSDVDWHQFCRFTSEFNNIDDYDVSARYSYGELRLTRLNFYAKIFLRKSHFEHIHSQYGSYFSRFYGPLLFVFGIMSVVLSAMQVEMAVEQVTARQWKSFWRASRWFSVISLIWAAGLSFCFIILFLWMFCDEWAYAIRDRIRKRRLKHGGP